MAKAAEEVAEIALRMLGELGTGQTAPDADLRICTDSYAGIWQQLQSPELLATWAVDADIPDEAVMPIAALIASDVLPIFQPSANTVALVEAKAANAKPQLRANLTTPWNYDTVTEAEYF